jgi:hypothetical protein
MFDALAVSKRKASRERRRKATPANVKLYEPPAELGVYLRLIKKSLRYCFAAASTTDFICARPFSN